MARLYFKTIKVEEKNSQTPCPDCGGKISLKNSRRGPFWGCENYPDCKFTRPLSKAKAAAQAQLAEPKFIDIIDPVNLEITSFDTYFKNFQLNPQIRRPIKNNRSPLK